MGSRTKMERASLQQILARLNTLKAALRQRLLSGDNGITDFRRFNLLALTAEVDRLIADATFDLAKIANGSYEDAANLGTDYATEPLRAAKLNILKVQPGLDGQLVQSAFGNTVDLLTLPMQQFGTDVKVALRRVTTAGDNRFEEIQRLRNRIGGAGFDNAQYKAERIIRTEQNRVFSQATFNRLVVLAKDFPFIRKGWRDSKDRRTRLGHLEAGKKYARGQGIPISQPFTINVYQESKGKTPKLIGQASLLFPLDPNTSPAGRIAAAATIMCRCNGFVDFDLAQYQLHTRGKLALALGLPSPAATPPPSAAPAPPAKVKKVRPVKVKAKATAVTIPKAADVLPKQVQPVDKLQATLKTEEAWLRLQKVEHAVIMELDGTVKHRLTDGKKSEVRIPFGRNEIKGMVFTHNHPRNSAFSPADIDVSVHFDLAEMRAVTATGTYRIRPTNPATGWPAGLAALTRGEHLQVRKLNLIRIQQGTLTIDEAEKNHWRMVWERVAQKEPGIVFTFEPKD